jgi:putative oxidoreductase
MTHIAPRWTPYLLSIVRIITGLLFFAHGAQKMWGFAGGRINHNFASIVGFGGLLETVGGGLLILGLFTGSAAFILCGEMAVAYFRSWAPQGFFPISNGGEEAVLFCFIFLWLVTAGPGRWSLDALLEAKPGMKQRVALWEPQVRSVLRMILAFLWTLHGLRTAFGLLASVSGRQARMPLALNLLPSVVGYVELAGGILLFLGLFTRPVAAVLAGLAAYAYFWFAAPRGPWPISNGGSEALLYVFVLAYLAMAGAGAWSLDAHFRRKPNG